MRVFALIALAGLAGCSSQSPSITRNDAGANVSMDNDVSMDNAAVANTSMTGVDPQGNAAAPASAATEAPLSGYVGHYPFDKVGGTSFLDLPLVRKAVAGAVPDAKVRDWIFDKAGPQTPIAMIGGKLAAWGCEAHNCGAHQWTVLIAPDGGNAEVCYLPDGADKPDWYAHGARESRSDACPSGS